MYYRIRLPLDILTLFATGFFFSAGHLFIQALYDDRYLAAGPMFEVLQLSFIEVRYTLVFQCLLALGKTRPLVPVNLIRLIFLYGLMTLFFANFGIDGALWVICGSLLVTVPSILFLSIRHGLFDLASELRVLPCLPIGYALGELVVRAVHF